LQRRAREVVQLGRLLVRDCFVDVENRMGDLSLNGMNALTVAVRAEFLPSSRFDIRCAGISYSFLSREKPST